jgi:hypothetical protein
LRRFLQYVEGEKMIWIIMPKKDEEKNFGDYCDLSFTSGK